VAEGLSWPASAAPSLEGLWHDVYCPPPAPTKLTPGAFSTEAKLGVFSAESHWHAVFLFEMAVAVLAVASVVWTLGVVFRQPAAKAPGEGYNGGIRDELPLTAMVGWAFLLALVTAGGCIMAIAIDHIWQMRESRIIEGFLSAILVSLPQECAPVRHSVVWGRLVGESAAFALGVAMSTMVQFRKPPTHAHIAQRLFCMKQLLYCASLLLVVGILMSRANFMLVLSHWDTSQHEGVAKALGGVVEAGAMQSGVGYSALLAVFYFPVRLLLELHVWLQVPDWCRSSQAREMWCGAHGLTGSWRNELQPILAVVAPLIAAPVLEALAR